MNARPLPHTTARTASRRALVVAMLASAAALFTACGGADDSLPAPAARVALDADVLGSVDAAAQAAAQEHGAPGEAERTAFIVHARRPSDATRLADELAARGFEATAQPPAGR